MRNDDFLFNISLEDESLMGKTLTVELNDDYFKQQTGTVKKGCVKALVKCSKISKGAFQLDIVSEGVVFVPCDRCLEDVELRINFDKVIDVNLGDEDIEDNDMMTVDKDNPVIDLKLIVYQLVEVCLPIKRVHEPGMCDDAMMRVLNAHQVARSNDGMNPDNDNSEDKPILVDQRWEKLKSFKP